MAVPMTVKIPEPMTAPMPSAVSETGPSVFLRAFSGHSESLISLSMDLRAKSCGRGGGSGRRITRSARCTPDGDSYAKRGFACRL